ncbi:MAG: uracil-DNA glycosylase [Bacteroidales bacterium]|jgi:uracil-DNA glycosylase|nr:uracil-DNA glycosylase [Bacteroidales bacterium]
MNEKKVNIEDSWYEQLKDEFDKEYFQKLKQFLVEEKKQHVVYPPGSLIFNAFNTTPFDKVKVVLLGQDPYHGPGQAHGLCFSVPHGIKPPPSLINMYKELNSDTGFNIPNHGNLESWAKQGVFLLNATLTVRANMAGSHQNKGWETFTDKVISTLSEKRENLVFVLWGRYAQAKEVLIDKNKHLVLKAAHPSPLSAHNGFFGCKHFSKINDYLREKGITEIAW